MQFELSDLPSHKGSEFGYGVVEREATLGDNVCEACFRKNVSASPIVLSWAKHPLRADEGDRGNQDENCWNSSDHDREQPLREGTSVITKLIFQGADSKTSRP